MKICIVDDEKSCIKALHSLLIRYGEDKGLDMDIDLFLDGKSFLSKYKPDTYDIVFLDIYIGDITGMDLASSIRDKSENGMIIFCTTSINDMPAAFRYHAFEYIIKPPEYDRIKKILDDALLVLPRLETYLDIQTTQGKAHIAVSSIVSVTSNGHYLEIQTKDKATYSTRISMTEFKKTIAEDKRFLMINKGILVNMEHIKNIIDKICSMNDGSIYPIKVRESSNIKKHWQSFLFSSIRKGQKS